MSANMIRTAAELLAVLREGGWELKRYAWLGPRATIERDLHIRLVHGNAIHALLRRGFLISTDKFPYTTYTFTDIEAPR